MNRPMRVLVAAADTLKKALVPLSILLPLTMLSMRAAASDAGASDRPNILVIMCDDLGYADVGFNGAQDIRTPSLDELAAAGTICTSGYVTHPFCGPSRMGLLSGRYPHAFGGQFNLPPVHLGMEQYNRLGIPEEETLISTVLQNAGYFTGCIGKWHLGEDDKYHPNNRGFDDFYGFLGGGHNYFPQQYAAAYERQKAAGKQLINDYLGPLQHNGKPTTEKGYLTDELTNHAVGFIEQAARRDQPFFLYLCYNAPHAPMEAKEEDLAKYSHLANRKRRIVAGMVAAVDRGVGKVADALRETEQFENTLLVFLSDNGGKVSLGSSNEPLRGTKGDTWEGGFRVPMFWHWPGMIPAQKYGYSVSTLDFYPTFAALAQAKIPEDKTIDGYGVLDNLIRGTDARQGGMIFSMRHRGSYSDISARRGDWKVTRYGGQPWRLFNIADDPSETKDLAAQDDARVVSMVEAAEVWSRSHIEPLWFHAPEARDAWKENGMPHFAREFRPDIGAPALPPLVHITDAPAEPAPSAARVIIPDAPPGVKLKRGDSTLGQYIAREKAKWEAKGWRWDLAKVEANFRKIDTDGDGIISGLEKKVFYGGTSGTSAGKQETSPPTLDRKLKKGDSDLAHFLVVRRSQAESKGQKFNQAGAEKMFAEMDTDGNGIVTGQEKKAYWNK